MSTNIVATRKRSEIMKKKKLTFSTRFALYGYVKCLL